MRAFLLLCLSISCVPALSRAQDEPVSESVDAAATDAAATDAGASEEISAEDSRARRLFQRGVELAARLEFARAADKFNEALSIRDAPAIRYNLASALFEMGRLVEAFETNRAVVDAVEVPDAVRQRSVALQRELVAAIGRLTVELVGDAADVTVTIDDAPLARERIGIELPAAPGLHVLVARRHGDVLTRREIRLEPGLATVVELHLFASPEEAAATGVTLPEADVNIVGIEREGGSRVGLWVGIGIGAAAIAAIVAVVAVSAGGTQSPIAGDYEPGVLTWR